MPWRPPVVALIHLPAQKMYIIYHILFQIYLFVDTTMVHDNLTLDEIKEMFFTEEEVRKDVLIHFDMIRKDLHLMSQLDC